ncbi:MAG: hypothetical protein ABI602_01030 [Candidatus Saccharibacteria bacterium]
MFTNIQSKIGLFILVVVIISGAVWYGRHAGSLTTARQNTASQKTTAPILATNAQALGSVAALYDNYLPLKAQLVADNGDNPNVEPAAVKAVRDSEDYFTPKLYDSFLADYMTEYQSSGKVTKDLVTCATNITSGHQTTFVSKTTSSAVINVALTLSDGTTKVVPVTVDLSTLKISKIDCRSS